MPCQWTLTKEQTYHTECSKVYSFPQGDDLDSDEFRFCPYCGEPLKPACPGA